MTLRARIGEVVENTRFQWMIMGTDFTSAVTTLRMLGTIATSRNARRIRKDRSTDSGPAAGSSATATMTKTFHGSRKEEVRAMRQHA